MTKKFSLLASAIILSFNASAANVPAHWKLAPTPPMGWNSYDAFGDSVTEAEFLENARYLKENLLSHGWNYAVVDYRWYDPNAHDNNANSSKGAILTFDAYGRLVPAVNRFPSAADGRGFKPIADRVHAMGLKFGIHIMRGIPRQAVSKNTPIEGSTFHAADAADTNSICDWCYDMWGVDASKAAGQDYYDSLFRLYASWDVDFVKVDNLSAPYSTLEVEAIRKAMDKCGRPMVFSTSPGETKIDRAQHVEAYANMWRTSSDFWDEWGKLDHSFDLAGIWQGKAGPGHWPDFDMLPLGRIGIRSHRPDRMSRFTHDEQLTLMSLWCILPSPLILGGHQPSNDPWTLSLITNDEVLAIDQDPLGKPAARVSAANGIEIWARDLADGSKAVALFNRGSRDVDPSLSAFQSPLVTRETRGLVDIDVDVMGAKKLYLVVQDGGDGYEYDHADWLEPKLISAQGEQPLGGLWWNSATSGWHQPQVNKSVSGGALKVQGLTYTNGIGTHSSSVIEYTLPAGCIHFTAKAGLDAAGVSQGNRGATVRFLVFTRTPYLPPKPVAASLSFSKLGFSGVRHVRDLWQHKNLANAEQFTTELPPHGCAFLKVW